MIPDAGRTLGDLSDERLLALFVEHPGEMAEAAFAALVQRHGPMVLRTCRSVLRGDVYEAEDAFQATFLVLARKGCRLSVRDSLGPWLHRVAFRVAGDARKAATRRFLLQRKAIAMASSRTTSCMEDDHGEEAAALHEEISRLPDEYRAALVLCDLQGLSHAEAARRLGWPVGTIKSRQARGRERLRGRLARRGLALSAGALAASLSAEAAAAVTPALARGTVRAAVRCASGRNEPASGLVTAKVLDQARRASVRMSAPRLRLAAISLPVLAAVAVGAGALKARTPPVQPPPVIPGTRGVPTLRGTLVGLRWKWQGLGTALAADDPADSPQSSLAWKNPKPKISNRRLNSKRR